MSFSLVSPGLQANKISNGVGSWQHPRALWQRAQGACRGHLQAAWRAAGRHLCGQVRQQRNCVRALFFILGNDLDALRSSIFSNLLIHIKNNIHRNFEDQKIFECGPVFFGSKPGEQIAVIGGIQIGKIYRKNWLEKDKDVDVFEIKDSVYKTLIELGIHEQDLTVIQESETYYHPGRSGKFYLNSNKQLPIANFGEINPKIVKELDIKNGPVFGFQILLNNIPVINKQNTEKKIKYVVSNFQKIERDFAFIIDKKFEAEKIINMLLNVDKKLIKKIRIFDVFQGGNIEKNKKSVALNLLIQSQDKTLNDKEIDELSDKIIQTMQKSFDATLRS